MVAARGLLLIGLVVLILNGCFAASETPQTFMLPVAEGYSGGCLGVGLDATITGDPSDSRIAWLIVGTGQRKDVLWPPGYRARFDPQLQILDQNGRVVLREGDHVSGACTLPPYFYLEPPF